MKLKWPSRSSVSGEPAKELDALLDERGPFQGDARGDPRLGEPRVVVGEAALGPRPEPVARRSAEPGDGPLEQLACRSVAGAHCEQLGGPEGGVGIRPGPRRVEGSRTCVERADRPGDSEAEERAALGVVGAHVVSPAAVRRPPVVEAPVGTLCVLDEAAIHACELGDASRGRPTTQRASVVVGAVAVLAPGLAEPRVLEQTDLVGQSPRGGEAQPASARARLTPLASSAYCPATVSQVSDAACLRATAAGDSGCRAVGEERPQRRGDRAGILVRHDDPRAGREQLDRVRERGRDDRLADAIASTSTPETTWSRERYGSRTTSALRISARTSAVSR